MRVEVINSALSGEKKIREKSISFSHWKLCNGNVLGSHSQQKNGMKEKNLAFLAKLLRINKKVVLQKQQSKHLNEFSACVFALEKGFLCRKMEPQGSINGRTIKVTSS